MSHLAALARASRPVGGANNTAARAYCAEYLRSLGFTVSERPFTFSALAGRYGPPIIGVVAGALMLLASYFGTRGVSPGVTWLPILALVATIVLSRWLGGPNGTRSRFLRENGVNLEAMRGGEPRVWLVAHIDSKSQQVSTASRTTGVVLVAVALIAGIALALIHPVYMAPPLAWKIIGSCAVLGGGLLAVCIVGDQSDGAADNASGVAAVLEAASIVGRAKTVGILITDGEELALAGSRAWVAGKGPAIALNCDTIDDDGRFVVMRYGDGADRVTIAAGKAVAAEDARALVIRPLPAVLTDSVSFRHAGWQTVTLSRGTLRTLNRIHTRRDRLEFIQGSAIRAAARVLARLVEELA